MAAKLPPIDGEKSCHDWNQWGKSKKVVIPPRVYEQHVPRAEKEAAAAKPKRVKRK